MLPSIKRWFESDTVAQVDFRTAVVEAHRIELFKRAQILVGISFVTSAESAPRLEASHVESIRPVSKYMHAWIEPTQSDTSASSLLASATSSIRIAASELTDKYEIIKGLTGTSYKARWGDKDVAITCFLSDADFIAFARMALVLTELEHPNLLRVYGFCEELKGSVAEFAPEASLMSYLCAHSPSGPQAPRPGAPPHRSQFTWSMMIRIALAVAQAMNYLHSRQPPLLHRNLTAANVLVCLATTNPVTVLIHHPHHMLLRLLNSLTRTLRPSSTSSCSREWSPRDRE